MRDRVTSNSALFESEVDGANPSPAANFRPVVKQDHVCPTNRCWGCNSLPGDKSAEVDGGWLIVDGFQIWLRSLFFHQPSTFNYQPIRIASLHNQECAGL